MSPSHMLEDQASLNGKECEYFTWVSPHKKGVVRKIGGYSLSQLQSSIGAVIGNMLGAFYRCIQARHGAPKAVTATAHTIARIVYVMLKYRKPYQDLGSVYYEERYRERMLRNLQRKASKFGLCLVPVST